MIMAKPATEMKSSGQMGQPASMNIACKVSYLLKNISIV
jgi:hypothetical protein